jgi:hypothetical protein
MLHRALDLNAFFGITIIGKIKSVIRYNVGDEILIENVCRKP